MHNKLKLTPCDFETAKRVYEEGQISPFTEEKMFETILYVILSATENNIKQVEIYKELLRNNLNIPENILAKKYLLEAIVGRARFPNEKIKNIFGVSEWWEEKGDNLYLEIKEDISDGKTREFELREKIADKVHGMGQKCASLFLSKCGYENIVPVDVWMMRFLKDRDYNIEPSNYRTNGNLTKNKYLECERIISGVAKEFGVSPMMLQCIIWGKYSSWKNKTMKNPAQLLFDFISQA